MNTYSPYIKKYLKKIQAAGYHVHDNGSQLYRDAGDYEILISDLTVRSLFKVETLLIWIKDKSTKVIVKELFFRHELMPLRFSKVVNCVDDILLELSNLSDGLKNGGSEGFLAKDLLQEVNT